MTRDPTAASARGQLAASFFSHGLAASDPASVAARIRTAIDLGVLTDGQALPRESTFAEQLGVTVFTLREALARLREEGLVVTRVGRGGGSFVNRAPPAADHTARARLVAMPSVELRDLGDWRSSLAAASAELASSRASPGDLARLAALAERTADSDTASGRRSAARFRIELAAAAQSVRLSEAHIRMQENHGDLFALPLASPELRSRLGRAMRQLVDAIGRADAAAARQAATAESILTLDALVRERFALLAPSGARPAGEPPDALASAVDSVVLGTIDRVGALAADIVETMRRLLDPERSARAYRELIDAATRSLGKASPAVGGMGVMFDPGTIPGHPYGGAWVVRAGEEIAGMTHPSDPERDDFYEYSTAEWLVGPKSTGEPAVVGPYVDVRGADDYIVTIAVPLIVDGRFLGVAAADLPLSGFEKEIAPALARATESAYAVVTAEQRVVASNTAALPPGVLLRDTRVRHCRAAGTGWSIVAVETVPGGPLP